MGDSRGTEGTQAAVARAVVRPGWTDVTKPDRDDERFHSVTTVLGALDKPALLHWAAEQTARAAVRSARSLSARIEEDGEPEVVRWLRDARFRSPKEGRSETQLGTAVHDACEQYALTGTRPDVDAEVRPFLDRFDEWVQVWSPSYEAAEAAVYNRTYGYAGTLDAVVRVGGMRVLFDYKSSRRSIRSDGKRSQPYPEVALQLAAYRRAEFMATWPARRYEKYRRRYYLLSAAEREVSVPLPSIDGGMVLHITPEHCDAYEVRCDEEVFGYFRSLIEVFRWQQGLSRTVIGAPLERAS